MASLFAALKAVVVASNVASTRVYQDEAPPGTTAPYVVIHDFLGDTSTLSGDGGGDLARDRILQADLYFDSQANDAKTTANALRSAINAAKGGQADDGKGFGFRVVNVIRSYWHDSDDVRYVLDIRVSYLTT